MSHQNVELVLALHEPSRDADLAEFFRDDKAWTKAFERNASYYHPDVECAHRLLGAERTYFGLEGLRASWLDWLAPWESYRWQLEEAVDCGDRVLLITNDFGRRRGSKAEVKSNNAALWTIREGKVARAEFYTDRDWARKDAGLEVA
jgi:ketosteroid isomerase-like protein